MESGEDARAGFGGEFGKVPAVAIVSDSLAGEMRCRRAAEAIRARVVATSGPGEATKRLAGQVDLDAALVEIGEDHGDALDALFAELVRAAGAGRYRSVVAVPIELVDIVAAAIDHGDIELLCVPAEHDRAAALGMALASRALALHDIGSERNEAKLLRLSEEVGRIARALAELTRDEPAGLNGKDAAFPGAPPAIHAEPCVTGAGEIRAMIRTRRLRERFFDGDLFADPAWDMLLDLMAARIEGRQVAVSSLCIAAAVPPTTALRWIRTMTERGVFLRRSDPRDGRRVFIELSNDAARAMERWFVAVRENGDAHPV